MTKTRLKEKKKTMRLKRANERMSDQTKEIENGGKQRVYMHKYTALHSFTHSHTLFQRWTDRRAGGRCLCNGSGNISSFTIYSWMEWTRCISGWDCNCMHSNSIVVNGEMMNCNAIDHASAPLLIFSASLFIYVSNETYVTDASSIHFFILKF